VDILKGLDKGVKCELASVITATEPSICSVHINSNFLYSVSFFNINLSPNQDTLLNVKHTTFLNFITHNKYQYMLGNAHTVHLLLLHLKRWRNSALTCSASKSSRRLLCNIKMNEIIKNWWWRWGINDEVRKWVHHRAVGLHVWSSAGFWWSSPSVNNHLHLSDETDEHAAWRVQIRPN